MLKSLVGGANKDLLVKLYHVRPLLHSVLVEGKDPNGLCGPLEDRFYEFSYIGVAAPLDAGTFRVGETCAAGILSRIPHPGLPCVNPFTGAGSPGGNGGGASNPNGGNALTLREELLQAINLLGSFSSFKLRDGPVRDLLDTLLDDSSYAPFPHETAVVNALIRSVMQKRGWPTLAKKVASLPGGRSFAFPKIGSSLQKAKANYQQKRQNGLPVKTKPAGYYDDWINI